MLSVHKVLASQAMYKPLGDWAASVMNLQLSHSAASNPFLSLATHSTHVDQAGVVSLLEIV